MTNLRQIFVLSLFLFSPLLLSCRKGNSQGLEQSNFVRSSQQIRGWDVQASLYNDGGEALLFGQLVFLEDNAVSEVGVGTPGTAGRKVALYPISPHVAVFQVLLDSLPSQHFSLRVGHPDKQDFRACVVRRSRSVPLRIAHKTDYTFSAHPPFFTSGTSLKAVTENGEAWAYWFAKPFSPALPPMQPSPAPASAVLQPDSLFSISSTRQLVGEGLFFLQSDTSKREGLGFRVEKVGFPKFQEVEDLVAPLLYISTNEETAAVMAAQEKKQALDQLWLKFAEGQVGTAKRMIRTFYQRVSYANAFFTDYKTGWKTDRGMIYIVFGEPEQRMITPEGERWFYIRQDKGTTYRFNFDFVRKENVFTGYHYTLKRTRNHKLNWYRAVAAWRNPSGW